MTIEVMPCPVCKRVAEVHKLDEDYYISHFCCLEYTLAAMGRNKKAVILQYNRKMKEREKNGKLGIK